MAEADSSSEEWEKIDWPMTENASNGEELLKEEEEVLAFFSQLDGQFGEFMKSLKEEGCREGSPENRWQEKTPQPDDEVHPIVEPLQKLKYDPEENAKEELALNFKDDENFYLNHKKYRMAVYGCGESLQLEYENPEVQAFLYDNRSEAQYFLRNYRSALEDAQKALKFKPNYENCEMRAAICAFKLKKFDLCTKLCLSLIEQDPNNEKAKELLENNKKKKIEDGKKKRQQFSAAKKRLLQFTLLLLSDLLNLII